MESGSPLECQLNALSTNSMYDRNIFGNFRQLFVRIAVVI
jgi:hypothetical protein